MAGMRDSRGVRRTSSLFLETNRNELLKPLYTLQDEAKEGYPSAYQIYINSIDEYAAAMELVGSMSHWRALCKLDWFMNGSPNISHAGLVQWREDMAMRDKSDAKQLLKDKAGEGDTGAMKALYSIGEKAQSGSSDKSKRSPRNGRKEPGKLNAVAELKRLKDG